MISKRTAGFTIWLATACLAAIAADDPARLPNARPARPALPTSDFRPPASAINPDLAPVQTISSLKATNNNSLVRVRGTIIDERVGEYIVISDATGTLFADTHLTAMPKLKEVVEVVGRPVWGGSGIRLKDAVFNLATREVSNSRLIEPAPDQLPVLTKAWEIRDLPPERAAWKYPVSLRGVVTYYVPNKRLCIQDDISGIYVSAKKHPPNLKVGDLVELEGTSNPGGYAPIVDATRITILGPAALPEPRQATVYQLASSQEGSQWVEVRGVAQSVSFTNGEINLMLNDPTGRLPVTIPADQMATNLLDAIIRVRGITASTFNNRRQFMGPAVLSPSLEHVVIEEPGMADPLSLPVRPVASLNQFRPRLTLERRVNIAGVVTLCQPGQWFFLQDNEDGVQVFTSKTEGVKPGDRVKAAGYPALGDYGSVLRDAIFRVERQGGIPAPQILTDRKPLNAQMHGRWVRLDAHLLDRNKVGDKELLKLQFGGRVIEAACLNQRGALKAIRMGSRVRLTGVYVVLADEARLPISFQLLVPEASHVQILQQPTWWTSQHTIIAIGTLMLIIGLITLWVLMLRRKVREQTASLQQSELKFRSLVEQSLVGVYIIQEGRFVYVNPRLAEIYGYAPEEMIHSCTLKDVTHEEDLPLVEQQVQRRISKEINAVQYSFRGRRKDGSVIFVEVLGSCTQYGGKPAIVGTLLDITERKRADEALAEASALLKALLEHSPDHIYFKDRNSRFVRYSSSFASLLNVPDADSLRGKTDFDIFTEEHARPAFEDEQSIMATGEPIVGKLERETHPDGRVTWALTNKQPWRDNSGRIIGTFGISKDVTVIKQVEQELACERELFRALVDNLPDTIYFKDRQSRFVRLSRSKVERSRRILLKRYRADNPGTGTDRLPIYLTDVEKFGEYLKGKSDFDIYPEPRARSAFQDEQEIIRTGQPLICKPETVKLPDGRICWMLTTKMPWRDANGNIIGTFGVSHDITELKDAEAKLEAAHQRLLETSRLAGMAEVATDVLHNVGNVLNSVNVSCSLTMDRMKSSKVSGLCRASALLEENRGRLGEFFTSDPRGKQIPDYIAALAEHLTADQTVALKELEQLVKHIDHIKQIVAMQQSYAKVSGVVETVSAVQLVEDALHINAAALTRHDVHVRREFEEAPPIQTEKHKVLQILVNLIRNAKYAMDESGRPDRLMTIKICPDGNGAVKIEVMDNGVGIPQENLTRIFAHGFTTRRNGHGFGLHSSALAVRDLGGSLHAHSDGLGKGATFTLCLPQSFSAEARQPQKEDGGLKMENGNGASAPAILHPPSSILVSAEEASQTA